jgi:hypothetical protein
MSSQVQALPNNVRVRRVSTLPSIGTRPFPDFDCTLQNLAEVDSKFGGFSFNLDTKLAEVEVEDGTPQFPEATSPFHGSFMYAFPSLRTSSHPQELNFPLTHIVYQCLARRLMHSLTLAHLTRSQRAVNRILWQR